ncbi:hypothetical protein K2173_027967 [Erythroxylum novogranatense]|uniref:Uncharacterized protein n=1 Tax=Erythroxylum novogranatense TaxID=1862640 RepID=A0AAV8U343_9ROSI|nr:hypothetical protein K2173_027967 [Erythroxylum novogranatense]
MSLPNFEALRDLHNSANYLLQSPEFQGVLVHQNLMELQTEFRRARMDEHGINTDIAMAYNPYRKKLKKETLKCLRSPKVMKNRNAITWKVSTMDQHLMLVVELLREARVTTISIVQSVLSLVSIPWLDQKANRKPKFLCSTGKRVSDFCDETAFCSAHKRLEAVEIAIEGLEDELDCMFRRLIQTRVSLLNILTN